LSALLLRPGGRCRQRRIWPPGRVARLSLSFSFLLRLSLRRRSFCRRFGFQSGQPLERSQTRHEAVFASLNGDELRKTVKATTNRVLRNGEDPFSAAVA